MKFEYKYYVASNNDDAESEANLMGQDGWEVLFVNEIAYPETQFLTLVIG